MTIQILPARLANQIAAGEVVERPASVVKELVENSLDSGATRIEIDIEKGGAKLIRVRDNGQGIPKDELTLALSRHATSKIHTLDDLEAIISLGFRGEALASISSVSRLSLTSRPATQEEAWQAHSEGRDMEVKLQPAAHPVGTTVEVLDLFFNTPARRKFLRTEKTEFTHIDELLKRIALSRFDVSIILKHNGKVVRHYRSGESVTQKEKRLAAVCGSAFVKHMLQIELEHNGLKLFGWITSPEGARAQNDLQYCYVNGRMMKDKLINHAIRQSYEGSLAPEQYAAYVLFIELEPHQVDVNVHPAKHEVRFHQARLVHDFIYQAIAGALAESHYVAAPMISESAFHYELASSIAEAAITAVNEQPKSFDNTPTYPGQTDYESRQRNSQNKWQSTEQQHSSGSEKYREERKGTGSPSKKEVAAYSQLMETVPGTDAVQATHLVDSDGKHDTSVQHQQSIPTQLGKAVAVVQNHYLLMIESGNSYLLSLEKAQLLKLRKQLDPSRQSLKSQPLLVPLSIKFDKEWMDSAEHWVQALSSLGIQLTVRHPNNIVVMGVPQPLRQQNVQKIISDLLSYAAKYLSPQSPESQITLANWLAEYIHCSQDSSKHSYTLSEAIQLISELENLWQNALPLDDKSLVIPVDFSPTIKALHS